MAARLLKWQCQSSVFDGVVDGGLVVYWIICNASLSIDKANKVTQGCEALAFRFQVKG